MSDVDKGATLLHLHKRGWEGPVYAVEHYPAHYFEHPALVDLDGKAASKHAVDVTGGMDNIFDRLGADEFDRLYDLADAADDKRRAEKFRRLNSGSPNHA
jgi:hypothetical protein